MLLDSHKVNQLQKLHSSVIEIIQDDNRQVTACVRFRFVKKASVDFSGGKTSHAVTSDNEQKL